MADLLIKHLAMKASQDSSLAILAGQWEFDERLLAKALQSVSTFFSHYSLHDHSHSRQILVNIERLLGPTINSLSATDTWLLLESAYWHDSGMIVTDEDVDSALKSAQFLAYVDDIRNSPRHELYRFCQTFNNDDLAKCFIGADSSNDAVSKYRQLLAEWFRIEHARRSKSNVLDPSTRSGISSPRTELIPERLFRFLAGICHMHGRPFQHLFSKEGLPFRETGMGQENCHPRFVACLLRLGDLLDIDDNRFCPVLQRIAGSKRSNLSRAHEDKHAAIRSFRLDRDLIEISAECESIPGYLEAFKWFEWIKQEIRDQTTIWQKIVPERDFGLLPSIGNISVRLGGEFQILSEGERPQFEVDGPKLIEIVGGENLYSTRFACIRELLQNAVDATLLIQWLQNKSVQKTEFWSTPYSAEMRDLLNSRPIVVNLNHVATSDDKTSKWRLQITDQGAGISRDDLIYMLKIGGSQRNITKRQLMKDMPEWMRPAGAFGIGFQTAFLLCDKVQLITKSVLTSEIIEATMYSPLGPNEGLVLVRELPHDFARKSGTDLLIEFDLRKLPLYINLNFNQFNRMARITRNSHDPQLDSEFPIEAAELADKIEEFSAASFIPINGEFRGIKTSPTLEPAPRENTLGVNSDAGWMYVNARDREAAFKYTLTPFVSPSVTCLYRGQQVESPGFYFPSIQVAVNILTGKAGKWLNTSREKIIPKANSLLKTLVFEGLADLLEQMLSEETASKSWTSETRQHLSLVLWQMAYRMGGRWNDLAGKLKEEWLSLSPPGSNLCFADLLKLGKLEIVEVTRFEESDLKANHKLHIETSSMYDLARPITREWLNSPSHTVSIVESNLQNENDFPLTIRLADQPQPIYSDEALAIAILKIARNEFLNRRYLLEVDRSDLRWKPLWLKESADVNAFSLFDVICQREPAWILLPHLFRTSDRRPSSIEVDPKLISQLAVFLQPHLAIPASIETVEKTLIELVEYIDDKVMLNHKIEWEEMRRK